MPAIALYAALLGEPDELAGLRADALATLGYVANWRAIFSDKSYWDLFAAPSPLEHTWSLSIEEQFYVVWPLIAFGALVLHRGSVRRMLGVTVVLLALSVVAMCVAVRSRTHDRGRTSVPIPARPPFWRARSSRSRWVRIRRSADAPRAFSTPPASGAPRARGRVDEARRADPVSLSGGLLAHRIAALVLIACAVEGNGARSPAALGGPAEVRRYELSYGIYLWHWPIDCVLTLERTHAGPLLLNGLRFATTLVVAVLSYRYFERPIRTRGLPFGKPSWVVPLSFALCAFLVISTTRARPIPPVELPVAVSPPSPQKEGTFPTPFSVGQRVLPPSGELRPGTLRVLVLGDSVAGKMGDCDAIPTGRVPLFRCRAQRGGLQHL